MSNQNQINNLILTPSQTIGLDKLLNNRFCFVTGVAGSGKTALINYFTSNFCLDKIVAKVSFTASNASNLIKDKENDLNGTIHSIFKIKQSGVLKPSLKPEHDELKTIFSKIDVLIIDEISMVRIDIFEYLIKLIAKANKYRNEPTKIIFVGDFYQLPPIVTDNDKNKLYKYYGTYDGYCFESIYWKQLPLTTIYLDQNIRSGKDSEFDKHLTNIKLGKDLEQTLAYFNKQVKNNLKPGQGIVELYATNKQVDKVNKACLKQIKGKVITIPAYYDDEVLKDVKNKKLTNKNLPCLLSLRLKPNAQVMFVVNDKIVNNKQRFVNGDLATVISCSKEQVVVKLHKNNKLVHLHHYNCSFPIYKSNGDIYLGQFKQYPLKLAYAITIHKAQGKTFDKVNLEIKSNHDLNPGLIYVALSRVKSINDLNLYNPLMMKDISFNKKVIEFYKESNPYEILDELFERI